MVSLLLSVVIAKKIYEGEAEHRIKAWSGKTVQTQWQPSLQWVSLKTISTMERAAFSTVGGINRGG